jgi:hypothetical protein
MSDRESNILRRAIEVMERLRMDGTAPEECERAIVAAERVITRVVMGSRGGGRPRSADFLFLTARL